MVKPREKVKRKFCAIDAEGDVGGTGLLGVAFHCDVLSEYLTDHAAIKEQLLTLAEEGYTFIAHNAEYDLSVIFWQLDIPMKAVSFNGRFNRGEWRYHKKKPLCQLWCTLELSGRISLDRLGKALGIKKYPTPQKLLGKDPDRYEWKCDKHNEWECISCYATRDAEICYRFMSDLTDTLAPYGVAPHRRLAGLASHVWRSLDRPQPIRITDRRIEELSRMSYHGGRVETFKLGNVAPCYTADVSSMYPSVMASVAYPSPQHMVYYNRPESREFIDQYEGIAECEVMVPNMYLPPLPLAHMGQLQYPIGRLRGVWTLHELRYAQSLGVTIRRVHRAAFATESIHPFATFISTLWEMREQYKASGDPRELFAKLLLNNLYGYLGMKKRLERCDISLADRDIHISKQPKSMWHTEAGRLFLTYIREQSTSSDWTNVLWASQTTAGSRVTLHRHMLRQGTDLLYCDTDSVFSRAPIIGTSDGLGALRDDGQYSNIIISAPKFYAVKAYPHSMPDEWRYEPCVKHHTVACDECLWRAKAKGVQRACALDFLRDGIVTFSAPIKPRSQSRRGILAGTWVDITRSYQNTPARRQPLNPDALISGVGWSETAPLFVGP